MSVELRIRELEKALVDAQGTIQRQQQLIEKRALQSFLEMTDGLDVVIRDARAGNEGAKQTLRTLNERLDAVRDLASPIQIVRAGVN